MESRTTSALRRFNYLMKEIDAAYHEAALKLGVTDSAMMILYTVYDNGGSCPLSEICGMSGISKQTINSALRSLERDGALRLESYSGRRKQVILTESGREFAERTVALVLAAENDIFSEWSEQERETYLRLTQRYLDSFREKTKNIDKNKVEENT